VGGGVVGEKKEDLKKLIVEEKKKEKPTITRSQREAGAQGVCTYNSAYRQGRSDAQEGKAAITGRLFRHCEKIARGEFISAYKAGYALGAKEFKADNKEQNEVEQALVEGESFTQSCKIKARFIEGYVKNLTKYPIELYGDMKIVVYDRTGGVTREEDTWQYSEIPPGKQKQVIYLRKTPNETRCEIDVSEALFVPQYEFRK
jgi:hypothetical protein